MTGITVDGKMGADKLEVCLLMIEDRRHPAIERMTWRAIMRKLPPKVVGHSDPFKVFTVAGEAIGNRPREFQRRVAQFACCNCVSPVQGKGRCGVIELQGIPHLRP